MSLSRHIYLIKLINIFSISHYIFVNLYTSFLKNKDKRYNNQLDSYSIKYANTFKLGIVNTVIGGPTKEKFNRSVGYFYCFIIDNFKNVLNLIKVILLRFFNSSNYEGNIFYTNILFWMC